MPRFQVSQAYVGSLICPAKTILARTEEQASEVYRDKILEQLEELGIEFELDYTEEETIEEITE